MLGDHACPHSCFSRVVRSYVRLPRVNRQLTRAVFPPAPQAPAPNSSVPAGPQLGRQRSPPDLHRQLPTAVFPAGPQPPARGQCFLLHPNPTSNSSVPAGPQTPVPDGSVPRQLNRQFRMAGWQCSPPHLKRESKDMPDRTPMQKVRKKCQIEYARKNVRKNAKICKKECQKMRQRKCQKGRRKNMPETVSADMPDRMPG